MTCNKCVYFRRDKYIDSTGTCRKNAPRPMITNMRADGCRTEWPIVKPDEDFCYEFYVRNM